VFGNQRSLATFEVVKMQNDYEVLIPVWYMEQHKAQGTTYRHLDFTECPSKCYKYGKKHPEWDITYDDKIIL
jgi:hypothetical protein